jgi:hypothetical protein
MIQIQTTDKLTVWLNQSHIVAVVKIGDGFMHADHNEPMTRIQILTVTGVCYTTHMTANEIHRHFGGLL